MAVAPKIMSEVQIAKEAVRGTAIDPPVRCLLGNGRVVSQREEETFEDQDIGMLARSARAPEFSKHWTDLTLPFQFDYAQVLLGLMAGMKGGVSGAGGGADKTWTFAPAVNADPVVDTFTIRYVESDGTNRIIKEAAHCFCTGFEVTVGDSGMAEVVVNMMGRKATAPAYDAVALPVLQPAAALLFKLYLDTAWATLGTTQITGQIYGISYKYDTGIFAQWYDDGRAAMDFSTIHFRRRAAELEIDVAVDPAAGFVPNEETARDAKTKRFVQIEALGPTLGGSTYKIELDGCYYHAADSMQEIGNDRDGNIVRRAHLLSTYDSTGVADVRTVVVNNIATFG